jgi:hypothetical protein
VKGYEIAKYSEFLSDSLSQIQLAEKLLESVDIEHEIVSATAGFACVGDRLYLDMVLDIPDFSHSLDNSLFFSLCVLPLCENPFTSDSRYFPVDFRYAFYRRHNAEVLLPEGVEVGDLPTNVSRRIEGAAYGRSCRNEVGRVYLDATIEIGQPVFRVSLYPELRELLQTVVESASDEMAVVLTEE